MTIYVNNSSELDIGKTKKTKKKNKKSDNKIHFIVCKNTEVLFVFKAKK